jgi:hypothetical protein
MLTTYIRTQLNITINSIAVMSDADVRWCGNSSGVCIDVGTDKYFSFYKSFRGHGKRPKAKRYDT